MAKTNQLRGAIDEIVFNYLREAWPNGDADQSGNFQIDDDHRLPLDNLMNDVMQAIRDNAA